MARKVKPKIKYSKNKKTPKAFIGAATLAIGAGKAIYGAIQARRAKKAQDAFDTGRLERKVTSATQKQADQPIDQSLIQGMKESQAADRASAMGALSKDPRNALPLVNALEDSARKQNLALLDKQQTAKSEAMKNLATEQGQVEDQRIKVAEGELEGIRKEKDAGVQNIFGGAEDVASGVGAGGLQDFGIVNRNKFPVETAKKGGKITEDGGVTPGEFDHNTNKIDMVQDGEKIGEATGGELILPPDDVEDIRTVLSSGDRDAAFELMKDLVAKYDENVIGEDEQEQQAEAEPEPKKQDNMLSTISARMGAYLSRR
tara:strand:- start:16339 stop:17286 length:948 start_codon:yes stop_codon:yes gene_type:complete